MGGTNQWAGNLDEMESTRRNSAIACRWLSPGTSAFQRRLFSLPMETLSKYGFVLESAVSFRQWAFDWSPSTQHTEASSVFFPLTLTLQATSVSLLCKSSVIDD